jgi:hypothetical protein
MFSTPHPMLASGEFNPGFFHVLVSVLGGLSGAALVIAIIGAAIGWGAAWLIDGLPAPVGIVVGIFGAFIILGLA